MADRSVLPPRLLIRHPPDFQGLLRIDNVHGMRGNFLFFCYNFFMDNKDDIRQFAYKLRSQTAEQQDVGVEEALLSKFKTCFPIKDYKENIFALYWPLGDELDCTPIIEWLLSENVIVALPVIEEGSRVLSFFTWDGKSTLQKGGLGTKEPDRKKEVTPDIVCTPLVAFDRQMSRLGRGGGYYDATLSDLRKNNPDVTAVGLALDTQLCLFPLPCEKHDEKLDIILTPSMIYTPRNEAV